MKIAIVGSGIAGLTCAWGLHRRHDITLFEADDRLGGHTNTVVVDAGDHDVAVDTGFIVFNDRTYPNFIRLLDQLDVRSHPTDMGFGVRLERNGLEYGSTGLNMLFAQRRNLLRPRFHRMIRDVLRFHEEARALLTHPEEKATLGEFLAERGYGSAFVHEHLVPMAAAIWSAEPPRILDFPAASFVRFYANHGLLQRGGGPTWRYLEGGAQRYVEALSAPFRDRVRLGCRVLGVRRRRDGVLIAAQNAEPEAFDQVVFACHSDQALATLRDPSEAERRILGAIRYQPNEAVLHTDVRMLPRQRRAWSCWNVRIPAEPSDRVQVTYHMNQLQRLDEPEQYCVTLNRTEDIDPERVLGRFEYAHPVFDSDAIAAQGLHDRISGLRHTHYCGAYWGYGFHEDGVRSALPVLAALGGSLSP